MFLTILKIISHVIRLNLIEIYLSDKAIEQLLISDLLAWDELQIIPTIKIYIIYYIRQQVWSTSQSDLTGNYSLNKKLKRSSQKESEVEKNRVVKVNIAEAHS